MEHPDHDLWQVICEHDLICLLALGLRKALGSQKAADIEPDKIEKVLRIAYESASFLTTALYTKIRAWEALNQPFRILQAVLAV